MREANVGFLAVCDQSGRVVGAVTDRDIALRLVADDHVPGALVESIMTAGPICCRPEDDVEIAEALMQTFKKSRVLCSDEGGHVVGIISLTDVARHETSERLGDLVREITSAHGTSGEELHL